MSRVYIEIFFFFIRQKCYQKITKMFEVGAMKCNGIFRYLILKLGYTLWKKKMLDALAFYTCIS